MKILDLAAELQPYKQPLLDSGTLHLRSMQRPSPSVSVLAKIFWPFKLVSLFTAELLAMSIYFSAKKTYLNQWFAYFNS